MGVWVKSIGGTAKAFTRHKCNFLHVHPRISIMNTSCEHTCTTAQNNRNTSCLSESKKHICGDHLVGAAYDRTQARELGGEGKDEDGMTHSWSG